MAAMLKPAGSAWVSARGVVPYCQLVTHGDATRGRIANERPNRRSPTPESDGPLGRDVALSGAFSGERDIGGIDKCGGICGIFYQDRTRRVDRSTLASMNRQITHRGPDDEGLFVDGNVGMAMRRLSIIDVKSGHQPLSNETGDVWIAYNGEVYNHQDSRKEMEGRGHRYRTHSDTESIVHLYEEYGRDCVQHLRGMFAFVIWDQRRRVLFGAPRSLGDQALLFTAANKARCSLVPK